MVQQGIPAHYPSLTGGLNSKVPPHQLDPSESPLLRNVVFANEAVEKRGGFIPFTKEVPRLNAIVNSGHHATGSDGQASPATVDYLIVPGMMIAGHRDCYDALTQFTLDFFIRVDDLTLSHGGNGSQTGAGNPFPAAPFDILYRPIITKGPLKKNYDQGITGVPAVSQIAWDDSNAYGPTGASGNFAMPFGVWLEFNSGAGLWEIHFGVHVEVGINFDLRTVVSGVTPEVGSTYHIIASCDHTNAMWLQVGVWDSELEAFSYSADSPAKETSLVGTTATDGTPSPIQIFDAPQPLIENATGVQTLASMQPTGFGQNMGTPGAPVTGGYFFHSKRFEGALEDLAIWKTALANSADTSRQRSTKISLEPQSVLAQADLDNLISFWGMTEPGRDYIQEQTGRGNHLYLTPDVPLYDPTLGGPDSRSSAAWWFNGMTSYAMHEVEHAGTFASRFNPNWRHFDEAVPSTANRAFFNRVVNQSLAFGLRVDFWVESIAEPFEQVLMDIHSVMRLAIGVDGKLRGYVRDSVSTRYSLPVVSSFVLEPGTRYSASLFFSGGQLALYFDLVRDALITTGTIIGTGFPPGGITFGMGARTFTNFTADGSGLPDSSTQTASEVAIDSRSGFCGHIEAAEILTGDAREPSDIDAPNVRAVDSVRRLENTKLWDVPDTGRGTIVPVDPGDNPDLIGLGRALGVIPHQQKGINVRYAAQATSGRTVLPEILDKWAGGVRGGSLTDATNSVRLDVYWVFARWEFEADDDLDQRIGYYAREIEFKANSGFNTHKGDETRGVYLQRSASQDLLGALSGNESGVIGGGKIQKRCIESDLISENNSADFRDTSPVTHRLRPYWFRAPVELRPKHGYGLVPAQLFQQPMSLIADYQHQESDERFIIAAVARNVYWAKHPWRAESPFDESDPACMWSSGSPGDFIRAEASSVRQGLRDNTITMQFWLKPHRLDGHRIVALRGDPLNKVYNYVIGFRDGSLFVGGTLDSFTDSWLYEQASFTGTSAASAWTKERLSESSLKVNVWNHVFIRIQHDQGVSSSINAWINGQEIRLALHDASASSGFQSATIHSGSPDAITLPLYLLGTPEGQERIFLNTAGVDFTLDDVKPFDGCLTEYIQADAEDTNFVPGSAGIIPRERLPAVAAKHTYYLSFADGEGYAVANQGTGFSADGAVTHLREVVLLGTVEEDSAGHPYDYAVFRDRLYITNGRSRMQEISFGGFASGLKMRMAGMASAHPVPSSNLDLLYSAGPHTPGSTAFLKEGTYQIWCAFVDGEGRESEPFTIGARTIAPVVYSITAFVPGPEPTRITVTPATLPALGTFTLFVSGTGGGIPDGTYQATAVSTNQADLNVVSTGPSTGTGTANLFPDGFTLAQLPRSPDPQVTGRRFFVSPSGGGAPLQHRTLTDNEATSFELHLGGNGLALLSGNKLLAPRARRIAVGSGSIFLANIPDFPAGGNAGSYSDGAVVTYFPLNRSFTVDSKDGNQITDMVEHLGRFYLIKRDSIAEFGFRGGSTPLESNILLSIIDNSVGLGGGVKLINSLMFGMGDRGVEMFNGSTPVYVGEKLEGEITSIARTDEDLIRMFGAFHKKDSQYWLSVRAKALRFNNLIYVLDSTPTGGGAAPRWSKFNVPAHTYMDDAIHPLTQEAIVLIGTVHGGLWYYAPAVSIDGHDDLPATPTGDKILATQTLSHTATTLTVAGPLDTVHGGLRGRLVQLSVAGVLVGSAFIKSNTLAVITLNSTIPVIGPTQYDIEIGAYDGFWTSPWLAPQGPHDWMAASDLELDFAPQAAVSLTVQYASAINLVPTDRLMPPAPAAINKTVDMTEGYMQELLHMREASRGKYFRIQIGTIGINRPFSVNAWTLRFKPEGIRGRPR